MTYIFAIGGTGPLTGQDLSAASKISKRASTVGKRPDRKGHRRMRAFELRGIRPERPAIASGAFSTPWHFIERDPVLAGHDRETLQAQLALQIEHIMVTDASVRDPLGIANRAIGKVRQEMRKPQRPLEVRLAS